MYVSSKQNFLYLLLKHFLYTTLPCNNTQLPSFSMKWLYSPDYHTNKQFLPQVCSLLWNVKRFFLLFCSFSFLTCARLWTTATAAKMIRLRTTITAPPPPAAPTIKMKLVLDAAGESNMDVFLFAVAVKMEKSVVQAEKFCTLWVLVDNTVLIWFPSGVVAGVLVWLSTGVVAGVIIWLPSGVSTISEVCEISEVLVWLMEYGKGFNVVVGRGTAYRNYKDKVTLPLKPILNAVDTDWFKRGFTTISNSTTAIEKYFNPFIVDILFRTDSTSTYLTYYLIYISISSACFAIYLMPNCVPVFVWE